MSAYKEYQIRVLVSYGGPDMSDLFRDALLDIADEQGMVSLVTVKEPVERMFSELTATEAEEITRRERVMRVDDDTRRRERSGRGRDVSDSISVRAVVSGRYRLDMVNAATGDKIGTMNTRPHDTWAMLAHEKHERVTMYCNLASAMHAPMTFTPTPRGTDA